MQRLSSHEVTRARQAKRPDRRGEIDLQRLSVQQATQATDIAKAVSPHGQLQKARPALPVRPSSPRGTPRGRSRSNVRSNEGGGRGIAPPPRRPNALGVRIVGDRILGREVLDRLIALLRVQYPGRTLGLDRTRERPAQVRTNDLAAETEFVRTNAIASPKRVIFRSNVRSIERLGIAYVPPPAAPPKGPIAWFYAAVRAKRAGRG